MKKRVIGFSLALLVTGIAAAAAPARVAAPPGASPTPRPTPTLTVWQRRQLEIQRDYAPADAYFGRLKMSYLGINNTFRDVSIESGDHTTNPALINKISFAEEALDAWAAKYPHDPQLARTYFLATRADRKIWVKANQDRAWTYLNRLVHVFPTSYFGKLVKHDLAIGFTEHYYADPVPCPSASPSPMPTEVPTPTPTPTPVPRGRGRSAPTPTPIAVAVETPPPAPTPSPMATSTVLTLAPNHKVEILPQACVPPTTPAPTPTPLAPAPAPTAS